MQFIAGGHRPKVLPRPLAALAGVRAESWLTLALFCLGFALVFRGWLFSGFDGAFGDKEDGYIAIAFIEHWHHVFTGAAHWTDPIFFYPQRGALGYTDAFFLLGLLHAPLRMLGLDTFTAYMLVMTTLAAVGFFGFRRLAVVHFGLSPAAAAVGAFLFAFANVDAVKLIHAQCYCAMFLPGFCDLALTAWSRGRRGAPLGAAVGGLYGALFLTSYETAWFFGLFLLLLVLLHPLVHGLAATRALAWEAVTAKRAVLIAAACGFALGIVPFLLLYLPVLLAGHSRGFAEVASNMPEWRDLANVTPENAVWGPLMRWLGIAGRPDRPVWEVELAFTPAVMAVFIGATIALARRMGRPPRAGADAYLLMLAAAVIIVWLLQMDWFGVRPWRAVWAVIPGGSALRYIFRIQLVANMFVCLVAARALARVPAKACPGLDPGATPVRRQGHAQTKKSMDVRRLATVLLCGFLVVEQINLVWPPIVSRREALAWIEAAAPPPAGCRTFYLAPGGENGGPIAEERQAAAMLFAEVRNIPTVNGYSSWFPDGWALDDPRSPRYPAAVRDWAARSGIARDLCALELPAGRWTPGLPP